MRYGNKCIDVSLCVSLYTCLSLYASDADACVCVCEICMRESDLDRTTATVITGVWWTMQERLLLTAIGTKIKCVTLKATAG